MIYFLFKYRFGYVILSLIKKENVVNTQQIQTCIQYIEENKKEICNFKYNTKITNF